ncbi:hypothetical protein TorRG33x02_236860 [Trema orientale]|uniref:Uncharacterized protein n=1 Tax=Trema orientale TaxID=63057 RepID=A0A2P5E046_TREOI|nr:hypothetical protein TorRG33x02_236860 [Trema orientale]
MVVGVMGHRPSPMMGCGLAGIGWDPHKSVVGPSPSRVSLPRATWLEALELGNFGLSKKRVR